MSGQVTYADTTSVPGALTVSSPPSAVGASAAIDSESLPPSTAMPSVIMMSRMASAASPAAFRPMTLPSMRLPTAPAPETKIPSQLPEIRFAAAATVPQTPVV